ncbi:cytoplasmic tRNA 2-thiolation protein 2 [Drosophila innubila]|uniref:cytoplasmic tRNA 2-thiolation protein 2 n=1 Tax=Drosophila innubila TaxID=198719 RepID=UPI00148E1709|nr:cytoplasmic tRNA 2-thiolation protein 2 [Drosophila innubila]
MCSIGEDDFGDEGATHAMLPGSSATGTVISAGSCNKCGLISNALYKLNFRAAECHECFLSYTRHKFRASLGAAKALPRNAEVLLLVDGSAESLVLLDMLHFAQTQNTFKRLHCNARVLYIDARLDLINDDPLPSLLELQGRYPPFQFYVVQLGADPGSMQPLEDYSVSKAIRYGKKLRSLTAHQDYWQQQRKGLIGAVAAQLQCSHVFEPSVSTTLATQLLTSVALGRGGSVALDVALLDDRLQDGIKLLRPLKDLNEQEVTFYVHAQKLHPFKMQVDENAPSSDASLQNLTRAFVTNLQLNYASTVSTVFRTGDKIALNRQQTEETPLTCALCQSILDCGVSDTLLAIEYSRAVSEMGVALHHNDSVEALEQRAKQRLSATTDLCHACRNIQDELTSDTSL